MMRVARISRAPLAVTGDPVRLAASWDAAAGQAWREWEPETLRSYAKLGEDADIDTLLATQVALTNEDVFDDWALLFPVCSAFNGREANFEWLDYPEIPELAYACDCLVKLAPHAFTDSARKAIGAACLEDGLLVFPWIGAEPMDLTNETWARGLLDQDGNRALAAETIAAWNTLKDSDLKPDVEGAADLAGPVGQPLGQQLNRLAQAKVYIAQRRAMPG
jgi:hypothetical protein